jgi:1,4-alpha-glucan branching enzyme
VIEKQYEGDGSVIVVLRLPPELAAETAYVVGEFNGWSTSAHEMLRDDDGMFVLAIRLDHPRAYRFRYLLDGERWENDWAADAYIANDFGGVDSVIDLVD